MSQILGIDLSYHNGAPDWDKIKADGVQFAMIRMGFGGNIFSQDDEQFERNVKECERVGIPWGAYLYSYALNTEMAKSEIAHAIRLLEQKHPAKVAFDMEDADHYKEEHGMPTDDVLVDICYMFLSALENEGYEVMLYANKDWLETKLNSPKLDKYDKWVAQWSEKLTYKGKNVIMWQFTNSGIVNGIRGRVDMSYSYVDFGSVKTTQLTDEKNTATKPSTTTYIIKKGDTFWGLEEKNKWSHGTLQKLNPKVVDPKHLQIGARIKVPLSEKVTTKPTNKKYVTVEKDDNLSVIAARNDISLSQIIKLNPQVKEPKYIIYPGQKIRVK